jgi:hypothetical protein
VSLALQKPAFVGRDWWDSVLRVAAASATKDELDRKVRRLTHDVYQAYQVIEGNGLSRERKDQINTLKRRARAAWYELHTGVEPPRPTRTVFVAFVPMQGPDGWVDVAAFEAAGGRARPAGSKWKLETDDARLAAEWGCDHTELRPVGLL